MAFTDKIGSRNNTSFTHNLRKTLMSIQQDSGDFLKYHQRIVAEYALKYDGIRGMLIYHNMGSGKTMLSISLAESFIDNTKYNRVIFISPKSLHENFKKDFIKFTKINAAVSSKFKSETDIDDHLDKYYSFVSLNASNMYEQVKRLANQDSVLDITDKSLVLDEDIHIKSKSRQHANIDNCIILFDEFHNFLNSIANGSSNAVQLYDDIMAAKNIKIFGLTGTPIVNDPYEAAIAFNIMAGNRSETLFGEDYMDFCRDFIENPDALDLDSNVKLPVTIKNKAKFQDRILGLVSYYGADTPDFKKLYPVEMNLLVKKVQMSSPQFAAYTTARDLEIEETKRSFISEKRQRLKKPSGSSSTYRVRTRQISNFLYPEYASKSWKDDRGIARYEKYMDRLRDDCFTKQDLMKWSPKIHEILTQCSLHLSADMLPKFKLPKEKIQKIIERRTELNKGPLSELGAAQYSFGIGPGLIYSQFLDSGIALIARALTANGMIEYCKKPHAGGTFGIISGDVSAEHRAELVRVFNDPENHNGSILSLLLITSTGAEGLSLDRGRHIHIMEPYWNWSRIRQVITRIIRLKSHVTLDRKDQFVQPYMYLSDYPQKDKDTKIIVNEPTTDVTLFEKAIINQQLIDKFLTAIQEASIDCAIHYSDGPNKKNCRMCKPTNRQLWYPDLSKDIYSKSPCESEEKLTAKSITLTNSTGKHDYYYTKSGNNIRVFEKQDHGYVEIYSDHPYYYDITDEIQKLDKS